jgi:tetratricopeptide (TPR) repeat protein
MSEAAAKDDITLRFYRTKLTEAIDHAFARYSRLPNSTGDVLSSKASFEQLRQSAYSVADGAAEEFAWQFSSSDFVIPAYAKAIRLFLGGDLDEALKTLDEIDLKSPLPAASLTGQVDALSADVEAVKRIVKGHLLASNLQFAQAASQYASALAMAPHNFYVQFANAVFNNAVGYFTTAAEQFKECLVSQSDTQRAATLRHLGAALRANNHSRDAEAALDQSLEIFRQLAHDKAPSYDPRVADTLVDLAFLRSAIHADRKALQNVNEAVTLRRKLALKTPPDPSALTELASALQAEGRIFIARRQVDKARGAFNEALDNLRIVAKRRQAYLPEATETLRLLSDLSPSSREVLGFDPRLNDLKPCAKDPTYQFLEALQQDAFDRLPDQRALFLNLRRIESANARRMLGVLPFAFSASEGRTFESLVKSVKLQTCFEEPIGYLLRQMEFERLERLTPALFPTLAPRKMSKFGTLPNQELNAFTIVDSQTNEPVVVFNTGLMGFTLDWGLMAASLVPSIKQADPRRIAAMKPNEFREQFYNSPEWRWNAIQITTIALHLRPTGVKTILFFPTSDRRIAAPLMTGMNTFASAHEYAHVVLSHAPPLGGETARSDNLSTSTTTASVRRLSWQKEFEADHLGIRLTIAAMQDLTSAADTYDGQWVFRVRGVQLFMQAMQMADDLMEISRSGKVDDELSESQRVMIRRFAQGEIMIDSNDPLLKRLNDHPPAWLRGERIKADIDQFVREVPLDYNAQQFNDAANSIIDATSVSLKMMEHEWTRNIRELEDLGILQ